MTIGCSQKLVVILILLISSEAFLYQPPIFNSYISAKENRSSNLWIAFYPLHRIEASHSRSRTIRRFMVATTTTTTTHRAQTDLQGRRVLLTGANGGLGRCLALALANCGVSVLILSGRKLEAIQAVAKECKDINPFIQTHCILCDLSNPESVDALASESLTCVTSIDILVNNGGVSSRSRFLDTTKEVDRQIMQINFFSGSALAKAFAPGMVTNGNGMIIWISSVQGLFGIPNRSSYAASKFAVQGYCESIRAELATSGVSVHCVSPGYMRTNSSKSAIAGDGTTYGKTDPTTAAGADPECVAVQILNRCVAGELDFIVAGNASAKAAIWLRLLCPSLLRYILVKRYEKSQKVKLE